MIALFRREAVAEQQQRLLGSILLKSTTLRNVGILWLLTVVGLLIAFFTLFGFTRKEAVKGSIVPDKGLWRVVNQQSGLVLERRVNDGELVSQGDVLFVLSGERDSVSRGSTQVAVGASLSARIDRLKDEKVRQQTQAQLQATALGVRRAAIAGQIDQATAEVTLQGKRIQLAEAALQRLLDLQKTGFVSEAQVNDKNAELIDQQSRLSSLERSRASLKTDLASIDAELRDLPLRSKREASTLERAVAELEQGVAENEGQRRAVVRAGMGGRVTALAVEPGQFALASQVLGTILPEQVVLEAELYAPTRAIGFVKPGTRVLLRYQAFPYQKFGQFEGMVREVAKSAIPANEIVAMLTRDPAASEPMYRIRVTLKDQTVRAFGGEEPLKAGMQLDASLVLEHRKLYEWVIDPLLSVTGRL